MGAIFLFLIYCVLISVTYADDESIEFDYDIYGSNDSISIWLDLTPVLTQPVLEDLLTGLDIFLNLRFKVEKPQKLIGYRSVFESKIAILLNHDLTKDNYGIRFSPNSKESKLFSNQMDLSDYLADSLQFRLTLLARFPVDEHFRFNVEIMSRSISPSEINQISEFSAKTGQTSAEDSFLGSVLGKFLEVIGFGEITYRITSPQFKIDQLETESD
ncbi:MAG: hypothetical protein ABIE07_07510 [Candidatus Zixiibacteriota bacterium]